MKFNPDNIVSIDERFYVDAFTFNPFGTGSLLEQAIEHVVNHSAMAMLDDRWVELANRNLNMLIKDTLARDFNFNYKPNEFKFVVDKVPTNYGVENWISVVDSSGMLCMKWQN